MTVKILTFENLKITSIKYILSFFLLCSVVILLINWPDLQSILIIINWTTVYFWSKLYLYLFSFSFLIFISLLIMLPEKFGYIINRPDYFLI